MDRQFCAQLNELLKTTYRAMCTMEEGMLSDLSEERLTIGEMHIIGKYIENKCAECIKNKTIMVHGECRHFKMAMLYCG